MEFGARGLLSLLFHGEKAIEVVHAAYRLGVLEALDEGPVGLSELSARTGCRPQRLDKLVDCLVSLGLVESVVAEDGCVRYRSGEPLVPATEAVVGEASIERDRDRQPWRALFGKLDDLLLGRADVPEEVFVYPPKCAAQRRQFEASMRAGIPPIARTFELHGAALFAGAPRRVLDVGGGDGSLAAALVEAFPNLRVDVYNLKDTESLVQARWAASPHRARLGFTPGDFLSAPLPGGYDDLLFVRVLHDWPDEVARRLLAGAAAALRPGGRIHICEEFRSPARLALQFFWSYFLIGVDSCHSRLRAVESYRRWLVELGLGRIRLLEGPFELVVAEAQ